MSDIWHKITDDPATLPPLKCRYMPLVVMAAAAGLALLVAVWGVLRVVALR